MSLLICARIRVWYYDTGCPLQLLHGAAWQLIASAHTKLFDDWRLLHKAPKQISPNTSDIKQDAINKVVC